MKLWPQRVLKSKLFLVVCLAVFIFLLISFGREFSRRYYLEQQIKTLENNITELETKNQEFGQLIEYFDTQNFTEEEARLKMGLKRPGEEVLVINQPETKERRTEAEEGLSGLSNFVKWWYYFFNNNG